MLKSSGAMGLATMISRVLGLVREQVYAGFMGDSAVASAFKLAFQVPNLFRRLLGEGALTAAFIPLFKQKEKTEGTAAMWEAANAVLCGLALFVTGVVAAGMLAITGLLALASMRYTQGGEAVFPPWPIPILGDDTRLMFELLRVMFPYLLLVCLAALCIGMLNARGHFFVPALSATTLNLIMIATVLWVAPRVGTKLETQVLALAAGIVVAGLAQLGFQLPTLWRDGYRPRWVTPWTNPTVREVVKRMLPAAVGVAAFQLNVLLIQGMAFWVDRTIVASFDYAVRLMEFPQGVVGISLATYLLPTLSGMAAEKKYPEFRSTVREGLGHLLFVNLLASVLLLVLATPIVRLLFEHGRFTPASTARTALALAGLAPGLVLFSTVNVLARAFYALGDTRIPMKISVFCLGLNLVFAVWLIGPFRQAGLGVANTLSAAFNVWLLLRALNKKLVRLDFGPLWPVLWALLGATVVAGLAALGVERLWEHRLGHANLALRIGAVFVPMLAGAAAYWGIALWQQVPQAREIGVLILNGLRRRRPPREP
jgi:putative peptidoglycan lipid II flippase